MGQTHPARPVSLLNHTTINLDVEVARKCDGGHGPCVPGGGPDQGGQLLPPRGVQELEEAETEAETRAGGGKEEEESFGQSLGKGG